MQSHYIDEKIFEWVFRLTAWCNVSSGLMQWDISSGFSGLKWEFRLTAWCNVSSGLMRWVISSGFSDFSFFEARLIFIFCRQCMNEEQNIRAKQASARNFDDFHLVVHIWRWGNALPEALASHLVFSILCWVRKGQKCRKVMMVRTVVQIVFCVSVHSLISIELSAHLSHDPFFENQSMPWNNESLLQRRGSATL